MNRFARNVLHRLESFDRADDGLSNERSVPGAAAQTIAAHRSLDGRVFAVSTDHLPCHSLNIHSRRLVSGHIDRTTIACAMPSKGRSRPRGSDAAEGKRVAITGRRSPVATAPEPPPEAQVFRSCGAPTAVQIVLDSGVMTGPGAPRPSPPPLAPSAFSFSVAGSLHRISRPFPLRGRVAPCADRTGDSPSHRSPPGGALASYSVGATTSPASRTCAGKSSWLSVVERDEDAPCVIVSPARCASVIRYPSPVNAGHPMFVYRLRPTIFTCACSFRARPHRLPARLQRPAPGCPIAEHG